MNLNYNRRTRILVLLAVFVVGLVGDNAGSQLQFSEGRIAVRSEDDLFAESLELLSKGRQSDAERLLDVACETHPSSGKLYFARGVLFRSRWIKRNAQKCFINAQKRTSDSTLQEVAELAARLNSGNSEHSLLELKSYTESNRADIYARWLLAIICREYNNAKMGSEIYAGLIDEMDVGPVMMHHTYANLLSEHLGLHQQALKHRYTALSLEYSSWALQGMASTQRELGRYEEAKDALMQAIKLRPRDAAYHFSLGVVLRMEGNWEDAIDAFKMGIKLNPKDTGITWYNIGLCQKSLGQKAKMRQSYTQSARAGFNLAQRDLAKIYYYGDGVPADKKMAYTYFCKWTKKEDPADALMVASQWLKKEGEAESLLLCKESLKLNPKHSDSMNCMLGR